MVGAGVWSGLVHRLFPWRGPVSTEGPRRRWRRRARATRQTPAASMRLARSNAYTGLSRFTGRSIDRLFLTAALAATLDLRDHRNWWRGHRLSDSTPSPDVGSNVQTFNVQRFNVQTSTPTSPPTPSESRGSPRRRSPSTRATPTRGPSGSSGRRPTRSGSAGPCTRASHRRCRRGWPA